MLKINSIAIEGFGSIQKSTDFDFTDGLHVVKGYNGHGKSTLFSALCWGLFQTNIKGGGVSAVATWEHLRLPAFKGTRVIVYLSVGPHSYMVARHLNYKGATEGLTGSNRLMVFKQAETGWELTDGQHKADQQEAVDTLLGMDAQTFLNSVMFGQRMKRLVEADADQKRAIFDKLFQVGFVDAAATAAKTTRDEITAEINKGNAEEGADQRVLDQVYRQIQTQQAHLDHFEADKAERVALAGQSLEKAKERVTQTEATLQNLKTALSKVDTAAVITAQEALQTAVANNHNLAAAHRKAQEEVEFLKLRLKNSEAAYSDATKVVKTAAASLETHTKLHAKLVADVEEVLTTCPTCGGPLSKDKIDEAIENLRVQADEQLMEVQEKADNLKAQEKAAALCLKGIREITDKLYPQAEQVAEAARLAYITATEEIKEIRNANAVLLLTEDKAKAIERQIHQCEAELRVFVEDVTKAEATLKAEEAKQPPVYDMEALESQARELSYKINAWRVQIKEKEDRLQRVTWWATKGFNAGGLRAHVFNSMLALLNELVKKYADRLKVEVVFGVDMTKANKPFTTTCYRDGHAIDYKDLSGGQKQRIDVAVAFAMHDLVAMAAPINLLVLDECMEGLDEEGVDAIFDLLRMKQSSGLAVYVITHQQSLDIVNSKSLYVSIDEDGSTLIS